MADLWPSTLPQKPRPQDFVWTSPDIVQTFKPDVGPLKVRPKSTSGIATLNCTFDLNEAQVTTFESFWRVTLNYGAKPFDLAHPFTDTLTTFRLQNPPVIKNKGGEEYVVTMSMLYIV